MFNSYSRNTFALAVILLCGQASLPCARHAAIVGSAGTENHTSPQHKLEASTSAAVLDTPVKHLCEAR